jgi:hypothetical protein
MSALEVQAILGLPAQCYDLAVASGLLTKSVHFEERHSDRTAQHNFFDILNFLLWSKYDDWSWIFDKEEIDFILNEVLLRGSYHLDQNSVIKPASIAQGYAKHGRDMAVEKEYLEEACLIIHEIEHIWQDLFLRVVDELRAERSAGKLPFLNRQSDNLKALLLSGLPTTPHGVTNIKTIC